jgi:hypothetical protein
MEGSGNEGLDKLRGRNLSNESDSIIKGNNHDVEVRTRNEDNGLEKKIGIYYYYY